MIPDQPLGVVELVMQSSMMAKCVLLILCFFSITSWAIMLNKYFVYKAAKNEDSKFLEAFSKSENLTKIYNFAAIFLMDIQEKRKVTLKIQLCLLKK